MKMLRKSLPLFLVAVLLLSAIAVTVSAIDSTGIASLGELGLNYSTLDYTDSQSGQGTVHSLVYNPKTAGVMAYVDNGNSGWGYRTLATATRCETNTGYNVVAGINNEFFSMSSGTSGVLVGYGMYITDGRIAQAGTGTEGNVLTFASDGTINALKSRLVYSLSVNGTEWKNGASTALAFINKRSSTWADGVYLWDSCCGSRTDSIETVPGIEIVCEKLDYTEISVGKTCTAKVVEIRENSYGSTFAANQFVLFVKNDSPLMEYAKTIQVNDQIDIGVEESIAASKAAMEAASTVTSVLYDAFVVDGKAVSTVISALPAATTERPRTGIGFKADGTVVMLVAEGDGVNGAAGVTCATFANMFIQAGCVTAYNLDGGGSSQIILDNEGTLEQIYGQQRGVGNSILLVERKGAASVDQAVAAALDDAIAGVTSDMQKTSIVKTAYDAAVAVKNDNNAMTSDYRAALYNLRNAIKVRPELLSLVASAYELSYENYSSFAWEDIRTALNAANAGLANASATADELNAAYAALNATIAKSGAYTVNVALGKTYTRSGVHTATANYDDANYTELTDGDHGTPGYGACWAGFYRTMLQDGYHVATIDLGEQMSGIKNATITFYYDRAAGCTLPTTIYASLSDTDSGFVRAGANESIDIPDGNQLVVPEVSIGNGSGRYVRLQWNSTGTFSFVSEIEVNVEHSPSLNPVPSDKRSLGTNPNVGGGGEESTDESQAESTDESQAESTEESTPAQAPDTGDNMIIFALFGVVALASAAVIIKKVR